MIRPVALFVALVSCGSVVAAAPPTRSEIDYAARSGTPARMERLLARGASVEDRDQFGLTPLHLAAEAQDADMVRFLLSAGANVNARDGRGRTPLHHIIGHDGRWDLAIDALLEAKGLNVELRDDEGLSLLELASKKRDERLVARLLERGAKDSVFAAVRRGDAAALGRMLDDGGRPDAADASGRTLLALAAAQGHVELIRDLHRRGAKLETRDREEKTPLRAAAFAGHVDAVTALLFLGADPNATDGYGKTFVDDAATRIRHRNGHDDGTADLLAEMALAQPPAGGALRAAALAYQAGVARTGKQQPAPREKDLPAAERLYRAAVEAAPRTPTGISARYQLSEMLREAGRRADAAEVLLPLLADDPRDPRGGDMRPVAGVRLPDLRHQACLLITKDYVAMGRHREALRYALLARDHFTYASTCGTGFAEHLEEVANQVKWLQERTGQGPANAR